MSLSQFSDRNRRHIVKPQTQFSLLISCTSIRKGEGGRDIEGEFDQESPNEMRLTRYVTADVSDNEINIARVIVVFWKC